MRPHIIDWLMFEAMEHEASSQLLKQSYSAFRDWAFSGFATFTYRPVLKYLITSQIRRGIGNHFTEFEPVWFKLLIFFSYSYSYSYEDFWVTLNFRQ